MKATLSTPVQAYYRAAGFQEVEAPGFPENLYTKVVRLLALRTGRLYLPGNILVLRG